jgi:hypothetical protein
VQADKTEHEQALDDKLSEHEQAMEEKVLVDALAQPGVVSVLPTVGSSGTVTFPNRAIAAHVLHVPGKSLKGCFQDREAMVLDVGDPPAGVTGKRFVYVAMSGTSACSAAAGWIKRAWLDDAPAPEGGGGDGTTTDEEGG